MTSAEASLRRLQTDRIDLFQVHHWDDQVPLDETLTALDTLVTQGKVRYVGCSNYSADQLRQAYRPTERQALGAHGFHTTKLQFGCARY